jgi:hypothetical protein
MFQLYNNLPNLNHIFLIIYRYKVYFTFMGTEDFNR